jgi:site-specific DNA recombinase
VFPSCAPTLDQEGVRSKHRILTTGRVLGGCSFGRGALYHLLRNRIYRGEVVHKGIVYSGEHQAIVDEELWNAVQAKLSGNVLRQRRTRIESGALLGGLIFDARGNRMSPTYTVRRGNRHRYYVSRALMQNRGEETGAVARVGAEDVERLVINTLARALSRDDLATDSGSGTSNTKIRSVIQESVERIVMHDEEIQIVLKARAGHSAAAEGNGHDAIQILKAPLPAARRCARKEILVPGSNGSGPRPVDHALILSVARARSWMRVLRRGEYADTAEIARYFGLSDPYVRRLLRFAYLAPDIVEAIVEGRQPRSLTVRQLLRGIPLAWSDQHAAFGIRH